MPHTITTTEGIIIGARYRNEANRLFQVFTRDLGLVSVHAQNIRGLNSKNRFHMQVFSHVMIDCVYTKSGWRLTGATQIKNCFSELMLVRGSHVRIFQLLRRLINGEEPYENLFDFLVEILHFEYDADISQSDVHALELLATTKILGMLGYIDVPEITELPLTHASLPTVLPRKRSLYKVVNDALVASQL